MKIIKNFFFLIFFLVLGTVLLLGYLGFIPGLSAIFASNKPRDLGVRYTEADRTSARAKSQIEYEALPDTSSGGTSVVLTGSRPVNIEMTSAEATALLNNRLWKYYPYKDVQVKFNADGTGEISAVLLMDKLQGYGAYINAPQQAIDFIVKYLPSNPAFYVKGKAALVDNKVSILEPQIFEIGRLRVPLSMFLSFNPLEPVYALSISDMSSELSKVTDKKGKVIEFINYNLSRLSGFYARSASFGDDKLIFDGNLPEKELTVR